MDKLQVLISKFSLSLREKAKAKIKDYDKVDLNRPVASWITEDRLLSGKGYEFNIILRTCGCRWALSQSGGCTMCGYFNDSNIDLVKSENIISQVDTAFQRYSERLSEIQARKQQVVLKIFTSGSFFDEKEISKDARLAIVEMILKCPVITEVVVESRPQFIHKDIVTKFAKQLLHVKLQVGIGLESSNQYIRETLINKGFSLDTLSKSVEILHQSGALAKIYLLLKPPFLTEKRAIEDAVQSIKDSIEIGADVISLNPVNVQKYTIVDYLHFRNQYRPPWIYSIFKVFQSALSEEILENVLILCDPSAAGKDRGVHNCRDRECNRTWLEILHEFILEQDISLIKQENLPDDICNCWKKYQMELDCK